MRYKALLGGVTILPTSPDGPKSPLNMRYLPRVDLMAATISSSSEISTPAFLTVLGTVDAIGLISGFMRSLLGLLDLGCDPILGRFADLVAVLVVGRIWVGLTWRPIFSS